MRTIGNPDLAGAHDQEFALRKRISMLLQHGIELFDLRLQRSAWEPKENDTSVGKALVEDQLAEIAIGNHENALLPLGNGKDFLVNKAVWWSWEIAETSWPSSRRCAMRRKSALWSKRNLIQA